jgi:hypothetical protein
MAKTGGTFRNILIWTYERGTLQYDIICALILAFIFFIPKSCFTARRQDTAQTNHIQTSRPVQTHPSQHQ